MCTHLDNDDLELIGDELAGIAVDRHGDGGVYGFLPLDGVVAEMLEVSCSFGFCCEHHVGELVMSLRGVGVLCR